MIRIDPVGSYNFLVTLIDSSSALTTVLASIASTAQAGFTECSGLDTTLETEDYREGGRNGSVLKFPTRVTWSAIRLRRGITAGDELWTWHHAFVEGRGMRRDGLIVLQNDLHIPVRIWSFTRGLPAKWTGPSLEAARSAVAVEELDIVHEGLQLVSSSAPMGVGG